MPIIICRICGIEAQVARSSHETCGRKECSYALRSQRKAETLVKTEGVQKNCETCFEVFVDVTRRQTSRNCPTCVKSNMVKLRRERGSYIQNEAQRLKKSESMKRRYESGWDPNTPEHREKLSRSMKERWASGEMERKTKETCSRKYKCNHHTQRESYIESIKKMSFAKFGFRVDLSTTFRSSWEANFARYLTYIGKKWKYEPSRFSLKSGLQYVPDFWVEDDERFYEVKGLWTGRAKEKVEDFIKEYNFDVTLIQRDEYERISVEFAEKIPNWEKN